MAAPPTQRPPTKQEEMQESVKAMLEGALRKLTIRYRHFVGATFFALAVATIAASVVNIWGGLIVVGIAGALFSYDYTREINNGRAHLKQNLTSLGFAVANPEIVRGMMMGAGGMPTAAAPGTGPIKSPGATIGQYL
jgi:hypothetical protein